MFLSLDKIKPNPAQPRKRFDQTALEELAASIREHGVIEPVIVEESEGGSYLIVAGERRCRAAVLAGLREIPALIRTYSEEKRMEVSIIENIQREDLNPIEEAFAYRQLMEMAGLSQDEAAAKVGKSRPALANVLRLLKLPEPVQEALKTGAITQGHARSILAVEGSGGQLALFAEIQEKSLSVRESEARAAQLNKDARFAPGKTPPGPSGSKARDPHIADMEQKCIEKFGTKVKIEGGPSSGVIRIDYYSPEDLDRLYHILL
jgi:ParB family chromosome partitioning protein